MPEQRIEEPNQAEREWIAAHVAAADALADEWLPDADRPLSIEGLDALWAAWLEGSADEEDANDVVHAVGLAFGQRLVEELGMGWKVVTDEYGTEMAVHREPGTVLAFPANAVAKRFGTRETGFLVPMRQMFAEAIADAGDPPKRRRGLFGRGR